ncbi:transaldolase family protein [Amedibacillus sp. YH-ame10]
MLYLIDDANISHIEDALSLGACGITANTSMYKKEEISIQDFIQKVQHYEVPFLSAEVIGTYEEMLAQAQAFLAKNPNIVIKINFSKDGLRLTNTLSKQGVSTALTLVFNMSQALAAINAGCDYIFFFIGRNEEIGVDALSIIADIQDLIVAKGYKTKLVGASIKHLHHLEQLANLHIDYAAIPYDLYMKSLAHPLTESGTETFIKDFQAYK